MSTRNLQYLFRPRSVAVIGASRRPGRVGNVVMRNLISGGFGGPILPVNPRYDSVAGVFCYPDVASLPLSPDLAVVCTPPDAVPKIVGELGARGTRAAIVLTAGLAQQSIGDGRSTLDAMLDAASPHRLRVLGPNCLGLVVPSMGLNASFAHVPAADGKVAFVSQSGALCTAVLDWAASRRVGFSHFVSLGECADVDLADVLDYLADDAGTTSILLYIESVRNARKFLSAARAAARLKPVLAIKGGRFQEGARAAASHTGALTGSDDVYDAAIRRAGILRVYSFEELFAAVETLARSRVPRGDHLMILTNGGGPGVIATDALVASGGRLAALTDETRSALDRVLPAVWSRSNPIDIIGDAGPERYSSSIAAVLGDDTIESLLVLHVPTAVCSSDAAADAVSKAVAGSKKRIFTCWLGDHTVRSARESFSAAGIPTYDTPEAAVGAFHHLVSFRRNQEALLEVPSSTNQGGSSGADRARAVIDRCLEDGLRLVGAPEAFEILSAYGVPVVETGVAEDPDSAAREAERIGFPVVLKLRSRDVSHKSDVGGVRLDLGTGDAVRAAANDMIERVRALGTGVRVDGFIVQPMVRRRGAHELLVGATIDGTFGPVIAFGQGGTAVEVVADRAIGLPPLNPNLARELIERTRVSRLLHGYRDRPRVDLDAVISVITSVSQLMVDHPEIQELDLNPLLADERGVIVVDARVIVERAISPGTDRLAIRPYPRELEEWIDLPNGEKVHCRPIRPEDEPAHYELFRRFEPQDVRFRFFGLVRNLPHAEMARYTQIDYDREMAFIATREIAPGQSETLGVVRAVTDPASNTAEFAIIVRSDIHRRGIGRALLDKTIRYCRSRGLEKIYGEVLPENSGMLALVRSLGFGILPAEGGVVDVALELGATGPEASPPARAER
jgi:acetyltransferase